ncbi:unnamed protein product [Diatraea saccharalis]|uniref:Uncharacterized protein n=1 Tax=Diatraea saccharalis TaxID=40085 RepID=A0A9P0C830_9NEOP|nr:unnamed protein product [Diatraea saccharalis]
MEAYCLNDINIGTHTIIVNNHISNCLYVSIDNGYGQQYYNKVYMTFKGHDMNSEIFVESVDPTIAINCMICNLIYKLDLSSNGYERSPTLMTMENLAILNLSKNNLAVGKLSNAFELKNLKHLDLSNNAISTIEVDQWSYNKLQTLNLSNNELVYISDGIFDGFSQLKILDLSHNVIDYLEAGSFEGLRNLSTLLISDNRLSEINRSLFRFTKLNVLDLSRNRLQHIKASDFDKLQELTYLDLSDNTILSIENTVFYNMPSLQLLKLNKNSLQELGETYFANFTHLEYVDFSKNNLKKLPNNLFKGNDISFFDIEGNNLEGSLSKGTFEGLKRVPKLDLSNQQLTSIEDYAFVGLDVITDLKLNKNKLQTLSINSFKKLTSLIMLDLSDNIIFDLSFDSTDLINLRVLSLTNNFITNIQHEYFKGLSSLHFLHLSNNNVTNLNSISFNSLRELIQFDISGNPLNGTLETGTFNGLVALPILDISCTQLSVVKNGSFIGMAELKLLNISHSKIVELQYNSFTLLRTVETIDLSFNQIKTFEINGTDLVTLQKLLLSHNLLKFITSDVFVGCPSLTKIDLSHNNIISIQEDAFKNQNDLNHLDVSFNSEAVFNVSIFYHNKNIYYLNLAGLKREIKFSSINENRLFDLDMSYADVTNLTALDLKRLTDLRILILTHNAIEKVEFGSFNNMTALATLDLSFNKITFIQPGVFTDNVYIHTLNVSHNSLSAVAYGVFKGLLYLDTLDMSYNNIKSLESERFFDVQSLHTLIVDYNNIDFISTYEFSPVNLRELSIGGNPISCKILANFMENSVPYKITAINAHESLKENIKGIACNNKVQLKPKQNESTLNETNEVLTDIRDFLNMIVSKNTSTEEVANGNITSHFITNITKEFEKLAHSFDSKLLTFINQSSIIMKEIAKENANITNEIMQENTNGTNTLLEKILKSINRMNLLTTPISVTKDRNNKSDDFIEYINNVRNEMADIIVAEKKNILDEVENKLRVMMSKNLTDTTTTLTPKAVHEKLISSNNVTASRPTLFTDICVMLILLILVCLILYKFYKSRMFVRARRSYSTRELPNNMESPDL